MCFYVCICRGVGYLQGAAGAEEKEKKAERGRGGRKGREQIKKQEIVWREGKERERMQLSLAGMASKIIKKTLSAHCSDSNKNHVNYIRDRKSFQYILMSISIRAYEESGSQGRLSVSRSLHQPSRNGYGS